MNEAVIDVARKGEAPLAQIAKDFGLSVTTLKLWISIAERKETGSGPGPSARRWTVPGLLIAADTRAAN